MSKTTLVQKAWMQGLFFYQNGSPKSICTGPKAILFAQVILTPMGKVALKNRTLGVPGVYFRSTILSHGLMAADGDPSFQKA